MAGRSQRSASSAVVGPSCPTGQQGAATGGSSGLGAGGDSSSWTQYVSSWTPATLAVPSRDFRECYTLRLVGRTLQVALLDGCRPNTTLDSRCNDLSYLLAAQPAAQPSSRRGRSQSPVPVPGVVSGPAIPIAASFAPAAGDDEANFLLVLLATGHLLAINTMHLGIEAVLGVFPEVAGVRNHFLPGSSLLAVMWDQGWAVVGLGAQLGLAPVESAPPESSSAAAGGGLPKPIDLPKGCISTSVASHPGGDALLLVGCSSGRLLLYCGSVGYKKQVSALDLTLVQCLDIASESPTGKPSMIGRLFGKASPKLGVATNAGDFCVLDMTVLSGAVVEAPELMAAGGGTKGGEGGLGVWQVDLEPWRDQASSGRKGTVNPCRLVARGKPSSPVLRVLLLAPGRTGSAAPLLLALDANADISFWAVQQTAGKHQLSLLSVVPGRCAWDATAAQTFFLAGWIYLLIGSLHEDSPYVGWLDLAAVIRSTGSKTRLMPPVEDLSATCLSPPLSASLTSGGQGEVAGDGEVYFISESRLSNYHAGTGRTVEVKISGVQGDWRALSIRAVFQPIPNAPPTHLLIAVLHNGPDTGSQAIWLVGVNGEVVRKMPGAFDATFIGLTRRDARVVWLTGSHSDNNLSACIAPAFGSTDLASAPTVSMPGVDNLIGSPMSSLLLYWGRRLQGGPLHLAAGIPANGSVPPPSSDPAVALPLFGPADLQAWRWDRHSPDGPLCLALQTVLTLWVVRFDDGGRTQAPPRASLVAWVDLQACLAGAGRALSMAWLRPGPASADGMPGVLLVSTLYGVLFWPVMPGQLPSCLVLTDRPQLLLGALLDRVLCLEVQSAVNVFSGPDRAHRSKNAVLPRGPRARVRARPLSLLEAAAAAGTHASAASRSEAVNAVKDSDWRLVPTVLPECLPEATIQSLWPIASTSDAPPQLSESSVNFQRIASTAGENFRGLAAIVSGLQSGGAARAAARNSAGIAGDEARAALQVENVVLRSRMDPARAKFLLSASTLLLDCTAGSGSRQSDKTALALASRGIAKHDLLPFGMLVAGALRGMRRSDGWHRLVLAQSGDMGVAERIGYYAWALRAPAPMAQALLAWSVGERVNSQQISGPTSTTDYSAAALLQQRFSEPPVPRRPTQTVQHGGQSVCQLHTATVQQWLGLRSTELQVRVLQALLQEVENAPGDSVGAGSGLPKLTGPPAILASGMLVYWRCADGEGESVRDSAGCFRAGRLLGRTEWHGPLPPDEPMEQVDEWGSNLSPNFAISFAGGDLRYRAVDSAPGEEDRQMLSLVGGAGETGAGLRHLRAAREAARAGEGDSDDDFSAEPSLGWTVEVWARIGRVSQGEVTLFSRPMGSGSDASAPLLWVYVCKPGSKPGFAVRASGRVIVEGPADVPSLAAGEWTHLALRSNLSGVEVWAGEGVALASGGTRLPVVPAEAGLKFGDKGLELTEIRVWGVFRSDTELRDEQSQPLPTLLSDERKTLKVRMIARGAVATSGPALAAGAFGLTQLVAPASRSNTRRRDVQTAHVEDNNFGFDDVQPKDVSASLGFDVQPKDSSAPAWGDAWGADDWPGFAAAPAWPISLGAEHAQGDEEDAVATESLPEDPAPPPVSAVASVASQPPSRAGTVPPSPASSLQDTHLCESCGTVLMIDMKFCRKCGAKRTEESKPASEVSLEPLAARGPYGGVVTKLRYSARPGDRELRVDSIRGFSIGDLILIGNLERHVISAFASIMLQRPLAHAHPIGTTIEKLLPEEPPAAEKPAPLHPPSLEDVLPAPVSVAEASVVSAADSKLFAAVHALEHRSYALASSNFRASMQILCRQLPRRNLGGGPMHLSPAIRARIEASSAYATLCVLLQRCEELRCHVAESCRGNQGAGLTAYAQANPGLLRRLCSCWACVLRVAKAPKHTVRFAVQGMAIFFTMAKSVGGWIAAKQVASALMGRCHELLAETELAQVEYVAQAAAVGGVARGASSGAACGVCPRCSHPLEPLAPDCGYCFAELVVCFRDLRLCDGRRALYCDVCSAAVSERRGSSMEWGTAGPPRHGHYGGGHPRHLCHLCGVGELLPRAPMRSSGEPLSF